MTQDPQNPDSGSPLPPNTGYEAEGGNEITLREEPPKRARKGKSMDELKANFTSVFGHGAGKLGIIFAAVVIVVGAALAVRGLKSKSPLPEKATQVDVPGAPAPEVSVDAVSAKEAERRRNQAALEAAEAAKNGNSYQPAFDPNIIPAGAQQNNAGAPGQPGQGVQSASAAPVVPTPDGAQQVQVVVPAGQGGNTAEDQRRQAEIDKRISARDAYIGEVRKGVLKSVDELFGEGGKGGVRNVGTYSTTSYVPVAKASTPNATNATNATNASVTANGSSTGAVASPTSANAKLAFKAGKTIFAETDAETNTDDGSEVFATVRGGEYDGAKLIGKVEVKSRNIGVRFTVLAPQDNRPTMTINAIAIREEDARQGVADTIDNHTLARYGALFTASILSGLGKAAAQPQGSVIILPNGQTVNQQDEVSGRRIAMYAAGEVGTNAAGEVRKFVDQPATYTIKAKRGLGVIFLTDVTTTK